MSLEFGGFVLEEIKYMSRVFKKIGTSSDN